MEELNRRVLELGRMHDLQSNYEKTLLLLSALKSGEITLEDFQLVPGGWNLIPRQPTSPEQTSSAAPDRGTSE